MGTKEEIFQQISELYTDFTINHQLDSARASRKARKSLGNIKKLITEYRRASVEESK